MKLYSTSQILNPNPSKKNVFSHLLNTYILFSLKHSKDFRYVKPKFLLFDIHSSKTLIIRKPDIFSLFLGNSSYLYVQYYM